MKKNNTLEDLALEYADKNCKCEKTGYCEATGLYNGYIAGFKKALEIVCGKPVRKSTVRGKVKTRRHKRNKNRN